MPENLPDHSHCLECDAAIPLDKKYCSKECEATMRASVKKQESRNRLFFLVVIVLAIGLGVLTMFL